MNLRLTFKCFRDAEDDRAIRSHTAQEIEARGRADHCNATIEAELERNTAGRRQLSPTKCSIHIYI